jgi:hypothetical protein
MFVTFINNRPMTSIPEGFTQTEGPVEQKVGKAAEEREAATGGAGGGDGGGGDRSDTTEGGRTVSSGMLDPTKPFEGSPFNMAPTDKQMQKAIGLSVLGLAAGNPLLGAKAIYDTVVNPKSKNVSGVSQDYVNHIEQQANAVSSGQYGISGSPFGSVNEAKAISQYGFMSDEHMDAVEKSMQSQLASSGTGGLSLDYSGAANTGMATTPGGLSVSNAASIAAQNEAMFGDSGGGNDGGSSSNDSSSLSSESVSQSLSDAGYSDTGGYNDSAPDTSDFARGGLVNRRKKKK